MTHRPLRVLLIANTLPPTDVSGVGEQVLQLAAGLRRQGCTVQVLGRRRGPKVLFPVTVLPDVWSALRRLRPHAVQVHESDGALAALLVRLLRPFLRPRPRLLALLQVSYAEERRAVRPLVAPDGTVLGRPGAVERRFRRGKGRVQVLLGRLTARLANRVLAPSARTAGEIRRDYGVGDVAVVPNVTGGLEVAPAAGEGTAEGVEAAEAAEAVDAARGALLFVGRLRIRKGVEVLLHALARLRDGTAQGGGPAPRLAVVGDGEHRAALEAQVAELELGDAVTFLGRRGAGEVRALLSVARALVVPSTYEGMPLVILEAMEAGVPVVASAVSGIPEVVVDSDGTEPSRSTGPATGWLVPPEDPAALAAALRAALADADEAERRGAAGRARLDACYRPRHAAAQWLRCTGLPPVLPPME